MEKESIVEVTPVVKRNNPLWKIMANPWVWMVAVIAFIIFVVIIFLIYKVVLSFAKPEVDPLPKKQRAQKPVAQPTPTPAQSQTQPPEDKKEEVVNVYLSSPVETKVETSETEESHGDENPKVEIIN